MTPKIVRHWSCRQLIWLLAVVTISLFLTFSHRFIFSHKRSQQTDHLHGKRYNSQVTTTTTARAAIKSSTKDTKVKEKYQLEKVHILPRLPNVQRLQILTLDNTTAKRSKTAIIFVTYPQSGASLIADVLSKHPEVFTYQDPLQLYDSPKGGQDPISRKHVSEGVAYLSDLLNCNILESKFGYSDGTIKTIAPSSGQECNRREPFNISDCVQTLCKRKKVHLTTTSRLYVQDLKPLMGKHDDVRVVILQRDPRVILHLTVKERAVWVTGSDMYFQGRNLCSRMLHDVQVARRLSGGKDFYRIVLFEHFLNDPEGTVSGLLNFMGVAADDGQAKKLLQISGAYKQIKRVLLNKWDSIPDDDVAISIDKSCTFFYKYSLYKAMKSTPNFIQRFNLCKYCT